MSSISATINGSARLVARGSEEEKYYRDVHLANNTFDDPLGMAEQQGDGVSGGDGGGSRFADGDEAMVIVVGIRDVRIADWKGAVRDWVIEAPVEEGGENGGLVNGLR